MSWIKKYFLHLYVVVKDDIMDNKKLKRKINFLTLYSIISSLVFILLLLIAFKKINEKDNLDELNVKRINIVDETGENLRMVISNEHRQHSGVFNGQKVPKRERPSGIIFFNSYGDECGGLVYDGDENQAGMVLSLDKFKDDQIMQLQYMEDTKSRYRRYGLQLWDYPKENSYEERTRRFEKLKSLKTDAEQKHEYQQMKLDSLLMEDRLFIGKNFNKDVGLFINDKNGIPRIKIYIDSSDNPKIELLDKKGNVLK